MFVSGVLTMYTETSLVQSGDNTPCQVLAPPSQTTYSVSHPTHSEGVVWLQAKD